MSLLGSSGVATTSTTTTWLTLAKDQVERLQLNPEIYHVLCAFGGPHHAPGAASLFVDNEERTTSSHISTQIETQLTDEIDADQAHMFARRFVSVDNLLVSSLTTSTSDNDDKPNDHNHAQQAKTHATLQLLRLGLYRRANQILNVDPPPRALRIRALVDFIWSQALVLGQADKLCHLPTLETLLMMQEQRQTATTKGDEFAPGCFHLTVQGATSGGPVHINVLRIRPGATRMQAVDARRSAESSLVALAERYDAMAATSGGFFLYSEPDIVPPSQRTDPVGLLVTDGVVVGPPVFQRAALLQTTDGKWDIRPVGMQGVEIQIRTSRVGEKSKTVDLFQGVVGEKGIRFVHRGHGESSLIPSDQVGISIVGQRVFEVSYPSNAEINMTERTMNVPLAGFVLMVPLSLLSSPDDDAIQPGDDVSYTLPIPNVHAAMAGGPVLYCADGTFPAMDLAGEDFCGSAPPVTFSQDETFDRNLLPRMGAGLTANGELVLAAIDGRNLDQALGLTLQGTADLLQSLGCVRAMNLDGGSSKRMYIRGKGVVCLSTTEIKASQTDKGTSDGETEKQRPVHSAILFLPT